MMCFNQLIDGSGYDHVTSSDEQIMRLREQLKAANHAYYPSPR